MIFKTPADKVELFIKAWDRLNDREKDILTKNIARKVKYEKIGEQHEITRQRVQQICSGAMKLLIDELQVDKVI